MDHSDHESLRGPEQSRNRAQPRDSLMLTAGLRVSEHADFVTVRVRNLSGGGLMAEFPSMLPLNAPVEVLLRGVGRVNGRVAWATDGRIGIAFDREIDPKAARKPVPAAVRPTPGKQRRPV